MRLERRGDAWANFKEPLEMIRSRTTGTHSLKPSGIPKICLQFNSGNDRGCHPEAGLCDSEDDDLLWDSDECPASGDRFTLAATVPGWTPAHPLTLTAH